MNRKMLARQIESLAALGDPIRQRLYLYVADRSAEVSRDEAAQALGISRSLAAFHLDKLVTAGLLEATFRRLSDRTGPGAGRPSKLYRRTPNRFEVSLPEQRYELAAHILASALTATDADQGVKALRKAARVWGRRLSKDSSMTTRRSHPLERITHALQVCGFEPHRTPDGEIVLHNCPFASLRDERQEFTCGMNLALIEGLVAGLDLQEVKASLAPRQGLCCVALRSG